MAEKRLTLDAFHSGEGTKKQRAQFARELDRLMPHVADYAGDVIKAASALAALGVKVDPDEDFPSLLARVADDARAAPTVGLITDVQSLRKSARDKLDAASKAARDKASRTRCGATPAQARAFVAKFKAKHGTERGSITAGALEFQIGWRTFSKLLRT